MNNSPLNPLLELPLQQVAQLLKLPTYVVVRLAYRILKQPTTRYRETLFFSVEDFKQLQSSIQLIRQGHSLNAVLTSLYPNQLTRTTREEVTHLTAQPVSHSSNSIKRLESFQKIKLPNHSTHKTISSNNGSSHTRVSRPNPVVASFPVLKKQATLPKEWLSS
jgi:hypothetical protein